MYSYFLCERTVIFYCRLKNELEKRGGGSKSKKRRKKRRGEGSRVAVLFLPSYFLTVVILH